MSNIYRECNFFNVIEYSSSVRIYDRVDEYSEIKKFDSLEDIFIKMYKLVLQRQETKK